nr:hypothetical protein [Tanacetum cinerariifolium]
SANKKQEFVKTDNKKVEKKDDEKKRDTSKVKCYNCKKEGHFVKDCKKEKLLDLMLSKRSRKNTKCVNVADEELTAAKHKLMLLVYCC